MSGWFDFLLDRHRWLPALALFAMVATLQGTVAAEDSVAPVPAESDPALAASIRSYEELISRTEIDEGAFSPALAEQLTSLGTLLQRSDQHDDAVGLFQRALHVSRVNSGLYDLGLVSIADRLIASHVALRDWKAADQDYRYWMWLHRRNYDDLAPEMAAIVARYGFWNLEAANFDTGNPPLMHLTIAESAFSRVVEILEQDTNGPNQPLVEALFAISLANLRLVEFIASYQASAVAPMDMDARFSDPFGRDTLDLRHESDLSFRRGRDALLRIIAITKQAGDPEATARAHAFLGDWYLQFGKRVDAVTTYRQAYQIASTAPAAADLLQQLFSPGIILPALPVRDAGIYPDAGAGDDFVLFSFDVAPSGQVTRVSIIEKSPNVSDRAVRDARRYLNLTLFRPVLVDGEPQRATDVRMRYGVE